MKLYRSHGITKDNMSENHGGWFYEMKTLGYNYRLTDIQAALGLSQLKKNPKGVERRNEIANKYKEAFNDSKIKYQELPEGALNAHHLFVVEVEQRDELYAYLKENGVFSQIHYIPVHTLPYYKKLDYSDAELENSEEYYNSCFSLPMYPSLLDEEHDFVIEIVKSFKT